MKVVEVKQELAQVPRYGMIIWVGMVLCQVMDEAENRVFRQRLHEVPDPESIMANRGEAPGPTGVRCPRVHGRDGATTQ